MKRYGYLDSLRGVAICGVVLTHVGQNTAGLPPAIDAFANFGLRGVQLFFMVSALTLSLVSTPDRFSPLPFFVRRFFRIAPMFYLAALFYVTASRWGWMSIAQDGVNDVGILATLLFLHGFIPGVITKVVPGGWSIASEAIFYALFPFLLRSVTSARRAWLLFGLAVVLALGDMAAAHLLPQTAEIDLFLHFNFLANLPAFASGLLLFQLLKSAPERRPAPATTAATVALMAVLAAFCFASREIPLSQLSVVPLLAVLVYATARWQAPVVVNPVLSTLGELSFSIYLVHFAVLHAIERFLPTDLGPVPRLVLLYVAVLLVSAVVSWFTFRVVERPMIALGRRLTSGGATRPGRPYDGHRPGEVPLPNPGAPLG